MSNRTATVIYNQQNKAIHRALAAYGMPYREHKDELLGLFANITGRKTRVKGLSTLTLGERHRIIGYFRKQGVQIYNPAVGRHLWRWRKGNPDRVSKDIRPRFEPGRPLAVPKNKQPLLSKVGAILADMKLPWSYADGIAQQMHGIRFVEWCSKDQLNQVVVSMVVFQRKEYVKDKRETALLS